jgi:ABC-type molybdate transport system substrate-binding protein
MNILHPELDAPIDNMKIHKDVAAVIKTLWGGLVVVVMATIWVVSLAADVESNTKELNRKADLTTAAAVVAALERIEDKIDEQAREQRVVSASVIRLETKVEALEQKDN